MEKEAIGELILLVGIFMLVCGWYLRRKFHAEANYKGIGSFRFTTGGFWWFVGYLLIVSGTSAVLVSLLLLFL